MARPGRASELDRALAAWKTVGWTDSKKAAWLYKRARRLARAYRLPFSLVCADLEADAQAILDAE